MVTLRLYDTSVTPTQVLPLLIEEEDVYRVHKYNGDDTLNFEIQRNNPIYAKISEEVKIEGFSNRFIVKKIDEHSDFVVVECELDYDDWKTLIFKDYRRTNTNILTVMTDVLPVGWHVNYGIGVDVSKRRTVEESDGQAFKLATSYDMIDAITSAYDVVFNFDVLNKKLYVINPESYVTTGEFIMEDLNLTDLGFNGDSTGFITRLYPYGKKDESTDEYVNIKSVNNNKDYIDNFQYSNKVVCGTWVDERYTVAQNLYDAAVKRLAELSKPQRSYTCNVVNFNEDIWLYKVITLIDSNRGTRVDHRVVEFTEYKNHKLDKCTLSSVPPSIVNIVKNSNKNALDEIQKQKTDIQQLIDEKTQQLSDTITGSHGGHFKWILDADGNPEELVNLYDSEDITRAQKVWRWNSGGLGHSNNGYNGTYGLALTKDGEINATMITTGILNANVIRAGIIQDVTGKNSWNLETGSFVMAKGSITLGSNFSVDSNGNLYAIAGHIGNWKITDNSIRKFEKDGYDVLLQCPSTSGSTVLSIGAPTVNNSVKWTQAPFYVKGTGALYATSAKIAGTFESTDGSQIVQIANGIIKGKEGSTQTSLIDMSAYYSSGGPRNIAIKGEYGNFIQAGSLIRFEINNTLVGSIKSNGYYGNVYPSNGITCSGVVLLPSSIGDGGVVTGWYEVHVRNGLIV